MSRRSARRGAPRTRRSSTRSCTRAIHRRPGTATRSIRSTAGDSRNRSWPSLLLEALDHVVGDIYRAADEQRILQVQVEMVVLRVLRQHVIEPRLQLVELLELAPAQ